MVDKTTMLAGSSLEYSTDSGTTWLPVGGVVELPDLGDEPAERDITELSDTVKRKGAGMEDPPELQYNANYYPGDTDQKAFRTLVQSNTSVMLRHNYVDGDKQEYSCELGKYKILGGAGESTKQFGFIARRTSSITNTEA